MNKKTKALLRKLDILFQKQVEYIATYVFFAGVLLFLLTLTGALDISYWWSIVIITLPMISPVSVALVGVVWISIALGICSVIYQQYIKLKSTLSRFRNTSDKR